MKYLALVSICGVLLSISACKRNVNKDSVSIKSKLTEDDFTHIEDIDANIYFATEANMSSDPNNQLMEIFRNKKALDMADPNKPRPFSSDEIGKLENKSFEQQWNSIDDIFLFDWSRISAETKDYFEENIMVRKIFNNADFKVVELAIAPMALLPLHSEPTPSAYFILNGAAEIMSDTLTAKVYTGTSVMFDSYSKKRVLNNTNEPLKILWFSWAPEGDKTYLQSGYYLTGSFPHVQSINAVLPDSLNFWDVEKSKKYKKVERRIDSEISSSFIIEQNQVWDQLENKKYYPQTPNYKSANEVDWVDMLNLDPKSFFFADDIKSLGTTLEMMSRLAKIKSVFRAQRPDEGYDLNYSYLAWGPQSKYITHSHAICEFYYILEGDVEYIIDGEKYHGRPGNFYFHPPYFDHEMRGLKKDIPFLSISGSWIPYGKRELFELPWYILEDLPTFNSVGFSKGFDFHDFGMKDHQGSFGFL